MAAARVLTPQLGGTPPPRRGRERFLIVRLAGKEFALETPRISGMMQMRGLAPQVFEGPPGWSCLIILHGRHLPVYSPNLRAGVAERPVTARTCLILVGAVDDPARLICGVKVDSVSRYEDLVPASIRGNRREGRSVKLSQKWRPVVDLDEIADYWARRDWADRSPTTS